MSLVITIGALLFLMVVAYRGYSVILFAPVAALLAVLLTDPSAVAPVFTDVFMKKAADFVKNYLPVFVLGAVFGKLIEICGFSQSIVASVLKVFGPKYAIVSIVVVCALLTYGGVSLFVVVFAVYPFAADMFRQGGIPKRLIPVTIALGSFTFTMDALPGSPQIQNIIPMKFFGTTLWASPILGVVGSVFVLGAGLSYLEWRRRCAAATGEGYGTSHLNEPELPQDQEVLPFAIAILPLVVVAAVNIALTELIVSHYGKEGIAEALLPGMKLADKVAIPIQDVKGIWAVEGALILGILTVVTFRFKALASKFVEGSKSAIAGALLASMNTAAEYGFGAVIAALPGFVAIRQLLKSIPNPLINEALTVTTLAGITGSASGGLGIALASMASDFQAAAASAGIPLEVLHRVASMASGGMDTLPHNGAVITLLAVTGLTHRQAYADIFVITCIKTISVFVVIAIYYATRWV